MKSFGRLFLWGILSLVLDSVAKVLLERQGILLGGFPSALRVLISCGTASFIVFYLLNPLRLKEAKFDKEFERRKGMTPFMLAAADGNVEAVRKILAAGEDVNTRDNRGGTALMFATLNHHTDLVRLLLDAGANPRLSTHKGLTALDIARNKDFADLQSLLDRGAKKD